MQRYPSFDRDNFLRISAEREGVSVFGTIGLLDIMYNNGYIEKNEYRDCLEGLLEHKERRLPTAELQKRLDSLQKSKSIDYER